MNFIRNLSLWSWLGMFINPILSVATADTLRPGGLPQNINSGELKVLNIGGKVPHDTLQLPLTHTDVQISVLGFVATATIKQDYTNPFEQPIEAVYTFPLPHKAAVDSMTMHVGDRIIRSLIKKRDEARQIYARAKSAGQRTALLEQERPNIFTQSVGNIMPGDKIRIEITYVDLLDFRDDGAFELVFPMVVGPRYIPGIPQGRTGAGFAADTNRVPDASRITPPVLKAEERSGHDITLQVNLDAQFKIQGVHSISHRIDITEISDAKNLVKLHAADGIPNKDFVLRYEVAGKVPKMTVIGYHDAEQGGYFTFVALPQQNVEADSIVPRDLIFILDTSGSMEGQPIEKSKDAMYRLIDGMRVTDRFNVVRFAGDTGTLWPEPRLKTAENVAIARSFVASLEGAGGTEMQTGIIEALAQPSENERMRLAFLLTDGYVGNENEILASIEKERRGARIFTLGVGSSVNRYLLDQAATIGLGEAFYVRQDEDATAVIDKIFKRVDRPNLAHVEIDWNGLEVTDLTPIRIPDLWQGQPILVHGRYQKGGAAQITIKGVLGSKEQTWQFPITLPMNASMNAVIATVWARAKVEELMLEQARGKQNDDVITKITDLGLKHKIMTQWTAFVAVEETVVNKDGKTTTIVQPVELPEGVNYHGVFGDAEMVAPSRMARIGSFHSLAKSFKSMDGGGYSIDGASGGGGYAIEENTGSDSGSSNIEFNNAVISKGMNELETTALPSPPASPSAATPPLPAFSAQHEVATAVDRKDEENAVVAEESKSTKDKSASTTNEAITCQYRALSVSGALKYAEVAQRLREVWPKLCQTLISHNNQPNSIALHLIVDASGVVKSVIMPEQSAIAVDLATVIHDEFKRITFAATTYGNTTVKLLLVFKYQSLIK